MKTHEFGECIATRCWLWEKVCKYNPPKSGKCRTDEDVSPSFKKAHRGMKV